MARINEGLQLTAASQQIYQVPSGQTLRITALQVSSQQALTDTAAKVSVSWSDGATDFALASNVSVPPESVVDLSAGEVSLAAGHTISAVATSSSALTVTLCGELEGS